MIDPVIFTIFGLEIYWYGLVYALGFLLSWYFIRKNHKTLNLTKDQCDTILIMIMIGGIIGGRMFHIVFYELSFYLSNPLQIFRLDNGGMSIHGGFFGGIIASLYYSKKFKFNIFKLTDLIVIPLSLVLAFGRIANFINQELVGKITTSSIGVTFPLYDSQNRFPYQLFESAKNMFVFQILTYLHYFKQLAPGIISALFLILYNLLRFFIDFTREPNVIIGVISMSQLLSLLGTLTGITLYIILRKNIFSKEVSHIKKHSK